MFIKPLGPYLLPNRLRQKRKKHATPTPIFSF